MAFPWTSGPTSGRSAACCSRCSRVVDPSTGTRPPTRSRRSWRPTLDGTRCRRRLRSWLRRLLRRCLEKDARRRLRDIGDALAEMDDPSDTRGDALETGPTPRRLRRRHQLALALALLLAGMALALAWRRVGALQSGADRDPPHHDRAAARPEAVLRRCHLRPGALVGRPPARLRRRAGWRHPALGKGARQPRVEAARWNGGSDAPVLLSRRRVDRLLCGWRAPEGGRLRRSAAPRLHREGAKPRCELGARRPHRVRAVGIGAARRRCERRRAPAHREPRGRALAGDPAGRPDGALHHATSLRDHVHRRQRVPRGREDHRLAARRTRRPGDGHARRRPATCRPATSCSARPRASCAPQPFDPRRHA